VLADPRGKNQGRKLRRGKPREASQVGCGRSIWLTQEGKLGRGKPREASQVWVRTVKLADPGGESQGGKLRRGKPREASQVWVGTVKLAVPGGERQGGKLGIPDTYPCLLPVPFPRLHAACSGFLLKKHLLPSKHYFFQGKEIILYFITGIFTFFESIIYSLYSAILSMRSNTLLRILRIHMEMSYAY